MREQILERRRSGATGPFEVDGAPLSRLPYLRGRAAALLLTTDDIDEIPVFETGEVVVHASGGDRDRLSQSASRYAFLSSVDRCEEFRLVLGDLGIDLLEHGRAGVQFIRSNIAILCSTNKITALVTIALIQPVQKFPTENTHPGAIFRSPIRKPRRQPVYQILEQLVAPLGNVSRAARMDGPLCERSTANMFDDTSHRRPVAGRGQRSAHEDRFRWGAPTDPGLVGERR